MFSSLLRQLADTVIILPRSQGSHNIQYQMYEKRMFTRASRSNFQRGITEADNREHRIDRGIEGGTRRKERRRFDSWIFFPTARIDSPPANLSAERLKGRKADHRQERVSDFNPGQKNVYCRCNNAAWRRVEVGEPNCISLQGWVDPLYKESDPLSGSSRSRSFEIKSTQL